LDIRIRNVDIQKKNVYLNDVSDSLISEIILWIPEKIFTITDILNGFSDQKFVSGYSE